MAAAKPHSRNKVAFAIFIVIAAGIVTSLILSQGGSPRETVSVDTDAEVKTLSDGTRYTVHPRELIAGGPPKDGIPSIDNPKFTSTAEAAWLSDDDLVLGLDYNGIVKAYPLRILNWHEIVNDFADDEPVLVTYCPLCRTGIAFKPLINGQRVEFGVSGKLWKSDLVMYDRLTDSYWSQVLGQAIVGELSSMRLEQIPMDTVQWKDWRSAHPDTLVLSRDTGHIRNYDVNPYSGYENSPSTGPGVGFTDDRLGPKEIVFGVVINNESKAYEEGAVRAAGIIEDDVGGEQIAVRWNAELNTVQIFDAEGERVDTFGHFWFAWAAFYPETGLYTG